MTVFLPTHPPWKRDMIFERPLAFLHRQNLTLNWLWLIWPEKYKNSCSQLCFYLLACINLKTGSLVACIFGANVKQSFA